MSQIKDLMDYTFISKYALYKKDRKNRESWDESVDRFEDMFLKKYPQSEIAHYIKQACNAVRKKEVLGSQRALQFAGPAIFKNNTRLYNCLSKDTKFITSHGVKSFEDYQHGDIISVLTDKGNWQSATVKRCGKDYLFPITFKKGNATFNVCATKDHEWILKDDSRTKNLCIGDSVKTCPSIFHKFNWMSASIEEKLYWCYGYVFGDGTKVKDENGDYKYSMVRLCDATNKFLDRFIELGFSSSTPLSCNGDNVCYTGKYLKTPPDPEIDNPDLIRAFVKGYLDADGSRNSNHSLSDLDQSHDGNLYITIQSSELDHIQFIRKCFPVAGVYITSETVRPYTVLFRIYQKVEKTSPNYTVVAIGEPVYDETWCLEVVDDHSFVFPSGITTGNCTGTYADRVRIFQESMYILLSGAGIGVSVQKHHVKKLPKFSNKILNAQKIYTIPDSIEGWSDAIGILISSFLENGPFPEYEGYEVIFDYSLIRPEGSEFSHGVGVAPGPDPLRKTIEKIRSLLIKCVLSGRDRLRPIDVYDILMHESDAVLSGGIRRSASIIIFSKDDLEMMTAKTGNWFNENPQRARSNNSVILLRNQTSLEEYKEIFRKTKEHGEPGIYWADSLEAICNACCEIGFYAYDSNGNSGTQMCNLSTINGALIRSKEDLYKAVINATILGSLQAGFTNFAYLGNTTEQIVQRESLLGVSITGIMDNPTILLDPNIIQQAAKIAVDTNKKISSIINTRLAARICCIKPEGTTSSLLGTASGIHPHHSRRFIRRVQANANEAPAKYYQSINPLAVTSSIWSANSSDLSISFACEINKDSITKSELDGLSLLEYVKRYKKYWVDQSKEINLCTQAWLSHNVSNTIHVKEDEWEQISQFIYDNRDSLAGISLISETGDKDYTQAPFCAVFTQEEIVTMYGEGSLFTSGLIENAAVAFRDLWQACDTILGYGLDLKRKPSSEDDVIKLKLQQTWCEAFKKFAHKYLKNDIKKTTYLLKDVYNLKYWLDLQKNHKRVDYSKMVEDRNTTVGSQAIACAGGACQI